MAPVEHPYFRAKRRPARLAGSRWRAHAEIVRLDTDEAVQHIRAEGATTSEAESSLDTALQEALARLLKPDDWGRDATVPHLIRQYLALREELYGWYLRIEAAAVPERSLVERDAASFERVETAKLQAQIDALTEAQRLELVTPTSAQRAAHDDTWILDELTAKKRLGKLIAHPSAAVQEGLLQLDPVLGGDRTADP
jgi:hypothetical protein